MLKFHPLAIVKRSAIAEDAFALSLAVPDALRDDYRFAAGQHLAIRTRIDGREERRTYSIVSPEGAAALTIGVRIHEQGRVSRHLSREAEPGRTLEVMTPNGSFQAERQPAGGEGRRYAAFAAGSGITPVLSIAASALARHPGNRFQLYYGNTSTARTMFLEEIQALKDRFLPRFSVFFVMSREPQDVDWLNGRIDAERVRAFARHDLDVPGLDEVFICGPGTLAEDVQSALAQLGLRGRVHVEHFTPVEQTPAAAAGRRAPGAQAAAAAAAASGADVTVVMDGRRRRFTMAATGEPILDAAERAGLDLPFSCRAGVCSTCRARLLQGTVEMENNVALEDWEVEAGYILCCQARPTSATVEISYDE